MQRAGGYTGYYSAYQRLRLESSRPLDAASATQFPPGTHKVQVQYVERGGSWVELELAGQAGRRIRWRLSKYERWMGLETELRIRVDMRGSAEIRICTDGSLLLVDPDGGIHDVESVADAENLCRHWQVELREPRVIGLA